MKKPLTLLLTLVATQSVLISDDGLYKIYDADKSIQSVEENYLIVKVPVKRIEILHIVLRRDTEKKNDYYWLECHMNRMIDPQGESIFLVDNAEIDGFVVRASKIIPKGSKWALLISKPEEGRKLMKKIAKIYELKGKSVDDQTKS